ncbi:phage major tail tube protein [Clostridium intestinale]|uniref:phage major tail tube protein n=1 Tax=Clostridium intestinale TaxID=36845 RepID=UPI002DD6AD34|nr:phage major tail tube protein [Clostridium intestinale]WRY53928.1 phage major tail tube protein [Clostridium intestinale]
MNVVNKVINYNVYERKGTAATKICDSTGVQLPSIEYLTDTIKGAGIVGEVDFPSLYQPGSMGLTINVRATNDQLPILVALKDVEIRWVTDVFDTNNVSVGVNSHKAFIKCINKKFDEGKLEPGSPQDGTFDYEVFSYKRIVNGKTVINIDKFNGIFEVNGVNLLKNVNAAL